MDIAAALAVASQGLKLASELRQVDRNLDEASFKLKIAELTGAMADLKLALADAKTELDQKDGELDALRKAFQRREGDTIMHQGFRYLRGSDDKPRGTPFCPKCELSGLLVHSVQGQLGHNCPNCKAGLGRQWTFTWDD